MITLDISESEEIGSQSCLEDLVFIICFRKSKTLKIELIRGEQAFEGMYDSSS